MIKRILKFSFLFYPPLVSFIKIFNNYFNKNGMHIYLFTQNTFDEGDTIRDNSIFPELTKISSYKYLIKKKTLTWRMQQMDE